MSSSDVCQIKRPGSCLPERDARFDCPDKCLVVAFHLVGVAHCELLDRFVEGIVLPEVACDYSRVSCSGVRPRQGPSAYLDILDPVLLGHIVQVELHSHVPQLPEIVITAMIVAGPAEEYITPRLQHPLPGYHSLSIITVSTLRCVRLEC